MGCSHSSEERSAQLCLRHGCCRAACERFVVVRSSHGRYANCLDGRRRICWGGIDVTILAQTAVLRVDGPRAPAVNRQYAPPIGAHILHAIYAIGGVMRLLRYDPLDRKRSSTGTDGIVVKSSLDRKHLSGSLIELICAVQPLYLLSSKPVLMAFPLAEETMPVVPSDRADRYWMRRALALAEEAGHSGEVPVGAVVVGPQGVLGQAANDIERSGDPTAHAEMLAMRQAVETRVTRDS